MLGRRKDGSTVALEIRLRLIHAAGRRFVLASVVDDSARRQRQRAQRAAIEGQLEFERFIAELSFQFINLPSDEVIEAIRPGAPPNQS